MTQHFFCVLVLVCIGDFIHQTVIILQVPILQIKAGPDSLNCSKTHHNQEGLIRGSFIPTTSLPHAETLRVLLGKLEAFAMRVVARTSCGQASSPLSSAPSAS
eukprot:2821584-Amphidinium_carterae.1